MEEICCNNSFNHLDYSWYDACDAYDRGCFWREKLLTHEDINDPIRVAIEDALYENYKH